MITNEVNISKESFPLKPLGEKPPYFTYQFIPSESGQWIDDEQKTGPFHLTEAAYFNSFEEVKDAISAFPLYTFPSAQPPLAAEKAPACE